MQTDTINIQLEEDKPYFENISIDITDKTIYLSYIEFLQSPKLGEKPPKSGFTLTRKEGVSIKDFREESFDILIEALIDIKNNNLRSKLKEKLKND